MNLMEHFAILRYRDKLRERAARFASSCPDFLYSESGRGGGSHALAKIRCDQAREHTRPNRVASALPDLDIAFPAASTSPRVLRGREQSRFVSMPRQPGGYPEGA